MIKFYVDMIKAGILSIDNVPDSRKPEVQALLGV